MLRDSSHLDGGDVEFRIGVDGDVTREGIDDHIDGATGTELSDSIIGHVEPSNAGEQSASGGLNHSFGVIGAGAAGHQAGHRQNDQGCW